MAYIRLVSVSIDRPVEQSAFRAGLGARWTFLSDHERRYLDVLGLRETTDTRLPAVRADGFHALPRPHHPRGVQRVLVLGPADRGGPPPRPAGDHGATCVLTGRCRRELVLVRLPRRAATRSRPAPSGRRR